MSSTDIITEADIGKDVDFFMDKMIAYGGTRPQKVEEPVLVILGGSPGVGKSTAIKKLAESNQFISGDNYLVISLDNLVENYAPYRQATRNIVSEEAKVNLTKKNGYNNPGTFKSNYEKVRKVIGKLSGAYLSHMRPFMKIRDRIFEEAVKRGYNIVYDTTFKKRDIIGDDILPYLKQSNNEKLTPSYNAIKVIHLYTLDDKTIKNRLNDRHQKFLRNKDYIRGIHTFLANKFLKENDEGFKLLLDKYRTNARFQFCEFENNALETPFTCGEYKADKAWKGNIKIETAVENRPTTPNKTRKAKNQTSPKRGRNQVNTKLSKKFENLTIKTRKNRLLEKLEESLNNNKKKNNVKVNNKIENIPKAVPELPQGITRRITRSMTKPK